jgi:hypothetical protein
MLQCKIVACKRYLDAAFGTLGDEATRQQKPDIWQRRRHFFHRNCPNQEQELAGFSGESPTIQDDIHSSRRRGAVLIAGLIAIVNSSTLEAPDLIPLVTALPALHAMNLGGERLCS